MNDIRSNLCLDPLEQFQDTIILNEQLNCPTSLTNSSWTIIWLTYVLFSITLFSFLQTIEKNIFSVIFDGSFNLVKVMLKDSAKTIKNSTLTNFSFVFIIIASINLLGLIPYSWTLSSWFTTVFLIGLTFLFQVNVLIFVKKQWTFFTQFLPNGTPLVIIPFLTLVEIISYSSRVISLSVRLFANMLSGHALLKILISFSWAVIQITSIIAIIIALIIWLGVTAIMILEIMVALLQAYVFTLLIIIYFNDVLTENH